MMHSLADVTVSSHRRELVSWPEETVDKRQEDDIEEIGTRNQLSWVEFCDQQTACMCVVKSGVARSPAPGVAFSTGAWPDRKAAGWQYSQLMSVPHWEIVSLLTTRLAEALARLWTDNYTMNSPSLGCGPRLDASRNLITHLTARA